MKTSLKKLRGFGLHKQHERRERRLQQSQAQLDELVQATQDMQDMRDCYDSLLSAAAASANSAYEFSESLQQMGDCLLEKTALNDDEESGQVLLKLGKVQFELQKLIDNYRSHIFRTITIPSESLLNELRIVEEMKRVCDEKRNLYEHMISRHKEKGRLRSTKGEYFSSHQLQQAYDDYEEEATLFVFRMKSLKRGQSRSLLTQAARHHSAQLSFFRKALKSLEAIEPHVKLVTEQQYVDYKFMELEDDTDDDDEDEDNSDSSYEAGDDSELSFDYRQSDQGQDVSTSRNSMELDNVDLKFRQAATKNAAKENQDRNPSWNPFISGRDVMASSKSAPLFAEKKFDSTERFRQLQPSSSRKFYTYALPTPLETKNPVSLGANAQVSETRRTSPSGNKPNMWHSSPLEQKKYEKTLRNEKLSGPLILNKQSVLKESNKSSRLPPPLTEGLSSPPLEPRASSYAKKIKRQAFSGPLMSKSWTNKPTSSASGPIASTGPPQLFSGSLMRTPLPRPSLSPKVSSAPSTFVSSPKISELHELPRPPAHLASTRPSNLIGHSGPLVSKGQELSAKSKLVVFNAVSTLLVPPQTITRSYSIPSRDQQEMELDVSKPLETPHNVKMVEDASPPLTPMSFTSIYPASTAPETVSPASQIRGAS